MSKRFSLLNPGKLFSEGSTGVSPTVQSEVASNYFDLTGAGAGAGAGWDAQAPNPSAAAATATIAMSLMAFIGF
ncbi:hypothetical protein AYO41_00395 [Verrucomicrobia bacterium SCGC AG-212-E04]|nr:hypothetical protein AYO41_00395 [Verrucomicrobia bacterium SCGC AG-212-E04]